jgi:hypothetical protein
LTLITTRAWALVPAAAFGPRAPNRNAAGTVRA